MDEPEYGRWCPPKPDTWSTMEECMECKGDCDYAGKPIGQNYKRAVAYNKGLKEHLVMRMNYYSRLVKRMEELQALPTGGGLGDSGNTGSSTSSKKSKSKHPDKRIINAQG